MWSGATAAYGTVHRMVSKPSSRYSPRSSSATADSNSSATRQLYRCQGRPDVVPGRSPSRRLHVRYIFSAVSPAGLPCDRGRQMTRFRSVLALAPALGVALLATDAAMAQQPDSVRRDPARAPAPPAKPAKTPDLDFSGVIFANWNYRTDRAARAQNRFDVERASLTFRMPVGDRTGIRITADI